MKLNTLRKQANEKGFTLIELMIVIAIIGILAAVAIPNFIEYKNKSYCTATVNDVGAIGGALADYFAVPTNTTAINQSIYLELLVPARNSLSVMRMVLAHMMPIPYFCPPPQS